MPQRELSPQEWQLVVRTLADLEHFLNAIDGNTFVEHGVALADADDVTSFVVNTAADRQAIAVVLRTLGFDPEQDPYPPPVRDQLAKVMGYAPELEAWKKPADYDHGD